MAATDTMPSSASLPSSGAAEPLPLPATHTLLPPSGMCKAGETDLLAYYQTDKKLIRLGRLIAAERPPHLKAIAPWEGIADYYRELLGRGGIPNYAFVDYRGSGYCGANTRSHPLRSLCTNC